MILQKVLQNPVTHSAQNSDLHAVYRILMTVELLTVNCSETGSLMIATLYRCTLDIIFVCGYGMLSQLRITLAYSYSGISQSRPPMACQNVVLILRLPISEVYLYIKASFGTVFIKAQCLGEITSSNNTDPVQS